MNFVDSINLTIAQSILILIVCLYLGLSARLEWAAGIYLSTAAWTRTIIISIPLPLIGGPVSHTWVFLATMVGALAVYILKNNGVTAIPPRNRWIVPWMLNWWIWIVVLLLLFAPPEKMSNLRSLLLYVIVPLPIVLSFGAELRRVRGFAIAYLLTTMVGGAVAFSLLGVPWRYVLVDSSLINLGVLRLNIINYHWFSYMFAISLLIVAALILESKRTGVRLLLMVSAAYCVYFLILAGSRQTIGSIIIILFLFAVWTLKRRGLPRSQMILLVITFIVIALSLYQLAPQLILRSNENSILEFYQTALNRAEPWEISLRGFTDAPLWGDGFTRHLHNIFLSALVNQGLIGVVFFVGFISFFIRQVRGVWRGKGTEEQAIWRMAFFCIVLFGFLHSQVSGDTVSTWELYWSTAFLWHLGWKVEKFTPVH